MSEPFGKALPQQASVGYIVKMFPRVSETFILNEILELERQGLSLRIFSLKRPTESVVHAQGKLVRAPITYLPERIYREPLRILRAQFAVSRSRPRSYRDTLNSLLRKSGLRSPRTSLLRLSQACCVLTEMQAISHLHAHYATDPCKVAFLAHSLTGIPYSVTTHAKDLFQHERLKSPSIQERLCRARFIVANSHYSAEQLKAHLNADAEVHPIYNGIDLDLFQRRQNEPTEPTILSVGRTVEKKGFSILIQACQILKDRGVRFNCKIVGRLAGALRKQIDRLGLERDVQMLGLLSHQEVLTQYQRAMVFALPCIVAADGDRDLLPNVLKEAMAVGVPVVTSRLAPIEELIADGVNGLLVHPGDAAALAEGLELLLTDAKLRQQLASQSRDVIAERFDMRKNFTQLKKLHLKVMQGQLPEPVTFETVEPKTKRYEPEQVS